MSKKLLLIISLCVLWVLAGSAFADTTFNNAAGDHLWTNGGNWTAGVPSSTNNDKGKIERVTPNQAEIHDGMAASCTWFVLGDNASGDLHMDGGTLTVLSPTAGDSWTILGYARPDVTGTLTMDGGTLTTNNRFYVGFGGNGILNMNGGTMNLCQSSTGAFGIGYGEGFSTGSGIVNLNGGTINVGSSGATANFIMCSPAGELGHLNITDGRLVLKGNLVTTVTGYKNNGYITAFNGLGDVIISYDAASLTTTVRGQMNPYKSRAPNPPNSAKDVAPYTVLSWVAGDTALTHDVYFGTDQTSVVNATPSTPDIYKGSQLRNVNTYTPDALEMGQIYYWRVDEVDDVNIYTGDILQFTVAKFALIDDFEKDANSADLQASWSNNSTGATLSLVTTGGHERRNAMKFDYDNSVAPLYSEAQTASPTVNWTVDGVIAMDIWYRADSSSNAAEPMYAALEDNDGHPVAVLVNSDPNAAKNTFWTVWHIQLSDFAGVNLANVKKLSIGFGSRTNPVAGGAGTVYLDDIKLYTSRCLYGPGQDLNGDCVVDFKDFAIMAGNWMLPSRI